MSHPAGDRPVVAFRTDSSAAIGSGHLRRCLAVAELLAGWGHDILFVCRADAGNLNADVSAAGFRLAELTGNASDDAAECRAILAETPALKAIVVDHYGLDAAWENALRPLAGRLAVIDDLADRPHACDLLIDATPGDSTERYHGLLPAECQTLFGPDHAMLRPEFRRLRSDRTREGGIARILISYGAVDAENHCAAAIAAVRRALGPETRIDVVAGRNAAHRGALEALAQDDPRLEVHIDTPRMAELMQAADLAIGAGGTTSWERACLGLPVLVSAIADNQRESVASLEAAGCALVIPADERLGDALAGALRQLAASPSLVRLMGESARRLVDGKGAARVARAICPPQLALRQATAQDSRDLWTWRNDPAVRTASKSSTPIAWEDHQAWFAARLANEMSDLLIAEDNGRPAGVLRFDREGDAATVSIYLTPGQQGRGIGPALLRAGEAWLREHHPAIKHILADILPGNRPSIEAFEKADYEAVLLQYRRDLKTAVR